VRIRCWFSAISFRVKGTFLTNGAVSGIKDNESVLRPVLVGKALFKKETEGVALVPLVRALMRAMVRA
jgi:hypothetical protein